jgi:type VI secretion system protein ImpH
MATQSRLEGASLAAPAERPTAEGLPASGDRSARPLALGADPTPFGFFQAVRLLMRLRPDRSPVGLWGDPRNEVARFTVTPSPAFPASEIQSLDETPDGPARMQVNFFGLTGPVGVLPLNYTALVVDRSRAKDHTLRDFLDLFHHRIISLFYRAWEKYRFGVTHERERHDRLTGHLKDLIGIGTRALQDRLPVRDESLLFYTGLLGLRSRPAVALQQLLEDYFEVPVEVEQFVGGWYPLELESQCSLGDPGPAEQLGLGAVAGDEIWDQQARVRVRIGPLTREQYDQFLPTGSAYERLRALTRFYGGDQFDFEIQLVLVRDDVPAIELGADNERAAPPLGWCTWLRSVPLMRDPDETLLTLSDGKAHP